MKMKEDWKENTKKDKLNHIVRTPVCCKLRYISEYTLDLFSGHITVST
jgi:hypothetical protein